jgi:hypothetical protein
MPFEITVDNLFSGFLGAVFGSVVGSLLTIGHSRRELRRAERLVVAERLHPLIERDARRPGLYGQAASGRDLDALWRLHPWPKSISVRRRVRNYQAAREQPEERDALGGVHYSDPEAVARAAAALLPFLAHR